jgi:hypothetical protein
MAMAARRRAQSRENLLTRLVKILPCTLPDDHDSVADTASLEALCRQKMTRHDDHQESIETSQDACKGIVQTSPVNLSVYLVHIRHGDHSCVVQ